MFQLVTCYLLKWNINILRRKDWWINVDTPVDLKG